MSLIPTKTKEYNKLLLKKFRQTFHKTDIKLNILDIPFTTKFITKINISNSNLHIKIVTHEQLILIQLFSNN